jgi:hypothetical protein
MDLKEISNEDVNLGQSQASSGVEPLGAITASQLNIQHILTNIVSGSISVAARSKVQNYLRQLTE